MESAYFPVSSSLFLANIGLLFLLIADTVPSSKPSLNLFLVSLAILRILLNGFVALSLAIVAPSEARPDNPRSWAYPKALPVLPAFFDRVSPKFFSGFRSSPSPLSDPFPFPLPLARLNPFDPFLNSIAPMPNAEASWP